MSGAAVKRVDPREHVLLRPDMYIGSTAPEKTKGWFVNPQDKLYQAEGKFVPGLYKIFDEIITNASDNKQRDKDRSKRQNYIKVWFEQTPKGKQIIVQNDGVQGFLTFNKQEKMYVPELAFGVLMTSSNYDDSEERVTGGRNGFGAKLTNIYSSQFIVEVCEGGKQYTQTWTNNMLNRTDPVIESCSSSLNHVKISFIPDYARFSQTDLDADNEALLRRRVFDIAGCNEKLTVYLNDEKLPVSGFQDYVRMFFNASSPKCVEQNENIEPTDATVTTVKSKTNYWQDQYISYYSPHDFWDIAVFYSEAQEFSQLSFVNSICTLEGGMHVELVIDNLIAPLNDAVKKFLAKDGIKDPKELSRAQVKNNIFIVIRSLIVNPSFDSQTKVALRTPKVQLKKTLTFNDSDPLYKKFIKSLQSNDVLLDSLGQLVSKTQSKILAKNDGAKKANIIVPKLDDAVAAGTQSSQKCYLFLTEGDSAKGLAVEGLSQIKDGRKYYGVFPLRGKVLNVREVSHEKLANNAEINNLKKILGLKQNCKYETAADMAHLRYGKVVIMADQDHDGSHIKGLILNVFDTFWPNLLKKGYLQQFITPIVRCRKRGSKEVVDFYTLPELEIWIQQQADIKKWAVQYYKGLGTSDKAEAREYFTADNIKKNQKQFIHDGDASSRLNLAFHKSLSDKRKDWLNETDADVYLDYKQPTINISDFVNKELVLFEKYSNIRSIPSLIDGLKPSQRKVLFASLKRNLVTPLKVVQLSGNVSEKAAYHHGETSLNDAIIGLAQYFTGANNLPILVPKGMFGSRARGGKDSAAPRYIFTFLQPIVKYLFMKQDENLYERVTDDNLVVEPIFYAPTIPMVLVNGATGIGTGYSSNVPQFNPRDIIHSLRLRLYNKTTKTIRYGEQQLKPWFRDWKGDITTEYFDENNVRVERWNFAGKFEIINSTTINITELPPCVWTEDYREMVQSWIIDSKTDAKGTLKPQVVAVNDFSDNDTVQMHIQFTPQFANNLLSKVNDKQPSSDPYLNVLKVMKLTSSQKTTNMVLHNEKGVLQLYSSVQQIIDTFYKVRMYFYQKRKQDQLDFLQQRAIEQNEKARFVQYVIEEKVQINNVKRDVITEQLWKLKFLPTHMNRLHLIEGSQEGVHDEGSQEDSNNAEERAYLDALVKRVVDIRDREKFFQKVSTMPINKTRINCYSYLLNMAIYTLTEEKYDELRRQADQADREYQTLLAKSVEQLWLFDLSRLELGLDVFDNHVKKNMIGVNMDIKDQDVLTNLEKIDKQYRDFQAADGDSDIEPELIKRVQKVVKEPKAKKAQVEPKQPKEKKAAATKPAPKDEKPSLLKKKDQKEVTDVKPPTKKKAAPKKAETSESEIDLLSDSSISDSQSYSEEEQDDLD